MVELRELKRSGHIWAKTCLAFWCSFWYNNNNNKKKQQQKSRELISMRIKGNCAYLSSPWHRLAEYSVVQLLRLSDCFFPVAVESVCNSLRSRWGGGGGGFALFGTWPWYCWGSCCLPLRPRSRQASRVL